jgi:hypothetical protein
MNVRPNPNPFRDAIMKLMDVQIMRQLTEEEVRQINFVIKSRAYQNVAAAKEEWLYPEDYVSKSQWNKFGHGYLFMPDPRPIHLGGEMVMGFRDGRVAAFDAYGRKPGEKDYKLESDKNLEGKTLYWFKGEFANLFGPNRRGRSMFGGKIDPEKDSDQHHHYHLSLQKKKYKDRKSE